MSRNSSVLSFPLITFIALSGFAQDAGRPSQRDKQAVQKSREKCSTTWALNDGMDYRAIRCLGPDDVDLHVVRIDPDRWRLDTALVDRGSAGEVARSRKAGFVINANFFDTDRKALGLVVRSGQVVKRPRSTSWQSILVIRKDRTPGILLPKSWPAEKSDAWMAVQAGPRLIVDGRALKLKESYPAARSGVCIQTDNSILFFATPSARKLAMSEIGRVAGSKEQDGGLACQNAMLFDGGGSTQLFLDHGKTQVSVTGDPAPVFIHAAAK